MSLPTETVELHFVNGATLFGKIVEEDRNWIYFKTLKSAMGRERKLLININNVIYVEGYDEREHRSTASAHD